jgi:hypothetical protein
MYFSLPADWEKRGKGKKAKREKGKINLMDSLLGA